MRNSPFRIEPATADRFDDVATILGPKNPNSAVCWCLTYRLPPKLNRALTAQQRPAMVQELCARDPSPGVLAYDGDDVVGWAGVAPRSQLNAFASGGRIPLIDDLPVWTVWCFRVRAGHRGRGIASALLEGAVEFAAMHGAPAIEGYPVDNRGARVDLTLAYVGTRSMFEAAGFEHAADTDSVSDGVPRVVMRRALTARRAVKPR